MQCECRAGICWNLGLEFGPTLHYTQLNSAQQVLWEIFSDICYVTLAHKKKKMQLCMGVYMIKISVHMVLWCVYSDYTKSETSG